MKKQWKRNSNVSSRPLPWMRGDILLHTLSINGYYPNMETSIFTIATLQL